MPYEKRAFLEMYSWQKRMQKHPSILNAFSRKMQVKINKFIPEKVHKLLTTIIKQMIQGVLFGAKISSGKPSPIGILEETEDAVRKQIQQYKKGAAVEGGITGAGGILLGLADFPILIAIKIKMLFNIASLYGFDVRDYRERVYILYIFQLAFSSQEHRQHVYQKIEKWEAKMGTFPIDPADFDWRTMQQEYRDYIDIVKMAQLIPGIGAVVGLIVNYRLMKKLGETAMNAYRMRIFSETNQIKKRTS